LNIIRKVKSGIYIAIGSPTTMIIPDEDAVYIVDLGYNVDRAKSIINYVNKKYNKSIKFIFSHSHPDHISNPKITIGEKYIHIYEYSIANSTLLKEILLYGAKAPKDQFTLPINNLEIDYPFNWNDNIGPIELIPLPGHSPGHTGFKFKEAIYVADAFFGDKLIRRVGIPFYSDHREALNSMRKLLEYAKNNYFLILSHGPIIRGERAKELIERNIKVLMNLKRKVLEKLVKPMTLNELTYKLTSELALEITSELLLLNEVTIKSIISELIDENKVEFQITNNGLKLTLRNN